LKSRKRDEGGMMPRGDIRLVRGFNMAPENTVCASKHVLMIEGNKVLQLLYMNKKI
jgi:hypothetical protein